MNENEKPSKPTYYGESVGHWEGDTLAIDSAKFRRWSLDDSYYSDPAHYRMHTDAFHLRTVYAPGGDE